MFEWLGVLFTFSNLLTSSMYFCSDSMSFRASGSWWMTTTSFNGYYNTNQKAKTNIKEKACTMQTSIHLQLHLDNVAVK